MDKNQLRGFYEVDINGQKIPTLLNLNAFRILSEKEGIKLAEFDKQIQDNPLTGLSRAFCTGAPSTGANAQRSP